MANRKSNLKTTHYVGTHHFRVKVGGSDYIVADEGILKVSAAKMGFEVIKFRMSLDLTVRQFPGRPNAEDVTIERVYRGHDGLWKWYQTVRDGDLTRHDVTIEMLKQSGETVARVTLKGAFPSDWQFPSPDAGSSTSAVEKITLKVENIECKSTGPST